MYAASEAISLIVGASLSPFIWIKPIFPWLEFITIPRTVPGVESVVFGRRRLRNFRRLPVSSQQRSRPKHKDFLVERDELAHVRRATHGMNKEERRA